MMYCRSLRFIPAWASRVQKVCRMVRYTYYTAPWAHCQPASSNDLQFVDDFLKLLALDLEAVAVHNEPVGVRVFLG